MRVIKIGLDALLVLASTVLLIYASLQEWCIVDSKIVYLSPTKTPLSISLFAVIIFLQILNFISIVKGGFPILKLAYTIVLMIALIVATPYGKIATGKQYAIVSTVLLILAIILRKTEFSIEIIVEESE